VFENEIQSIGNTLSKLFIFEDLFAPFRELEDNPYTFTSELEISLAY
jgi:hypothetical protein